MAENTFKVTIITPDGTVYDNDKVTMLVMNTAGGQMGIMANHVPLIAVLEISTVRIKHSEGTDEVAAVNGERAQRAKKRSESAIAEAKKKHNQSDLSRAEVHLKRAINRLNAASKQRNI